MAAVQTVSAAAIAAVSDAQVRTILRQLVDAQAVRSGDVGSGDEAFLTLKDITGGGKTATIAAALARPIAAEVSKPGTSAHDLAQQLEQTILAMPAWQQLFSRIELLTAPDSLAGSLANQLLNEAKARGAAITTVNQTVQSTVQSLASTTQTLTAAINNNAAAIKDETTARATAVDAATTKLTTYIAKTDQSISGMQTSLSASANSDNALAQAINTLWGKIGTNSALVSTGSQITVNNVGSAATKFDQLQATISDPVTGLVASYAAFRSEYSVTNNKVDGLMGKYSVKLDLNGYVSGFSLNSGVSTGGKQESSFLVLADKFAVGAPNHPDIVPFAIDGATGLVSIRGDLLVKKSITAASGAIGDAAITNANIKNAAVDTLKIGANSVIVPAYLEGGNDGTNYYSGTQYQKGAITIVLADTASIVAIATWQTLSATAGEGFNPVVDLAVDGSSFLHQSNSGMTGYNQTFSTTGRVTLGPGAHTFTISFGNDWRAGWYQVGRWSLTILGVMR